MTINMMTILKNLTSFILPLTVLVFVPRSIERDWIVSSQLNLVLGAIIGLIGLTVMFICISSFIRIGKGTLAPWFPPKKFIVSGLYRYVRNPMILGVLTVLLGESLVFSSKPLIEWAGAFFVINTVYFFVVEEPQLEERFGDSYREYKKHVRRWVPRFTPYQPKPESR